MGERLLKCFSCKQQFPKGQLSAYAAPGCIQKHNYCAKCLNEKHEREHFNDKV